MTDTIQTVTTETPKRFQCRHIHTEGRRCGSASLRGEEFCYFHHTSRKPVANPRTRRSRQSTFDLPLPEDRGAIQISIGEVLRRIASNSIDPRRAGLLLYGLQIAALNLPPHRTANTRREQESSVIEEIVTHLTHGPVAPACELPSPDEPHKDSLTARLLQELRKGREEIEAECRAKFAAELQPNPAILPTLNAAAALVRSEAEQPASRTCSCRCFSVCHSRRESAVSAPETPNVSPGAPFMTVSPSWVGFPTETTKLRISYPPPPPPPPATTTSAAQPPHQPSGPSPAETASPAPA